MTRAQRCPNGHSGVAPKPFLISFWNLVGTISSDSLVTSTQDTTLLVALPKRTEGGTHEYVVRMKVGSPIRTAVLNATSPSMAYCAMIFLHPILN